ncbi:polysaccharide deacetylase family protein [Clostridium cellulovorans]|uniref:Polysaccharide deacetylase n=2 Tax=Clostridium cellulovorans TaxID=1493 RepID=D9SQX3_CLOC7|nr:polysaccharide deacetylase family protein [Clostridium cellulovorans]ADL50261.1 polysaccharide deacetylase [Clostridium cellulovorans 743B]BAV13097.1 polysaccharide deacetylase [Clostridium cellulovorans]
MSKAYLTIDDGPTKNTKGIIDFLNSKNIKPLMFFVGENICKNRDIGIYAIQNGAIIGNHSYSHPEFSNLSLDECISEIERQEEQVNLLYKDAGVTREYKLFRFPYGDKGGKNKDALQKYFREHGFSRIDDSEIKYDWYHENNLNTDYDVLWTFDFAEYMLEYEPGFTYDTILSRINDVNPKIGGSLFASNVHNIILIHDHEETDAVCPNYFYNLINYVLEKGVEFVNPKFIISSSN